MVYVLGMFSVVSNEVGNVFTSKKMSQAGSIVGNVALWSCEGMIFKAELGLALLFVALFGLAGRVGWYCIDGCLEDDMISCFAVRESSTVDVSFGTLN